MHLVRRLNPATPRPPRTPGHRGRRFVFFALAQIVVLIGGVAFAEWLAAGTGNGYAKARHAVALRTSVASASETLYPGSTGDVVLTIANDNPFPVTVRSITGNGAITSGVADCDTPGNGVTFTDQTGTWAIAASSSSPITLTGAVAMAATSPDACQGATFTIPVGVSSAGGAAPTPPPASSLQLSPTSSSFGGVLVGQASAPTTFTVTNTGAPTAAAPTVTAGPSAFSITASTCVAPLATGGTCTVDVKFVPPARGAQNGTLTASVTGATVSAALSGTGQFPAQLVASAPGITFPTVAHGQSSTSAFTVINSGDTSSGVPAVSITGPNASDFSILTNGCTASIPGGTQCQVVVRFAPSVAGPRNATATVTASPGGGINVALSGTAT